MWYRTHLRPSIKAGLSPTMPARELSRGTTLEPAAPTPRCRPVPTSIAICCETCSGSLNPAFACRLSACWVQRPAARLAATVRDKYLPRDSSCRGCSELACWTFVDAANQVSWVEQSACCLKNLYWENWAHTRDRTFPRASVSYHSGWSPARSSQWYKACLLVASCSSSGATCPRSMASTTDQGAWGMV